MKPAAVTKKPVIDTGAALRFAAQEAPQAIEKQSARNRARPAGKGATDAGKRVYFEELVERHL